MLLGGALLLTTTVAAAPVTLQDARNAASVFMAGKGMKLAESVPLRMPGRVAGQSRYYVFEATGGQGYVVMSGDDRTLPVLGYSLTGAFDEERLPEGLRWLLQHYSEQIARLDEVLPTATSRPLGVKARVQQVRRPVAPLLKMLWNQGDPYNLLCPRYYNDDGSEGNLSATGCVATAIAQVMGYYRYPAKTKRVIPGYVMTYNTAQGEKNVQLKNIPSGSVIDWDNILDEYHGEETDAQKQAIAELMYWVGLGCKMGYGASSGAGFPEGVKALINYFGYDDGTRIESRGSYTAQGWEDLLYNELVTGHPIAFAGTNSGGAHAFVLDGYDIDGLFHVNWGWGGMDNGYFRIDVLAPDDNSGIGASVTPDAYNMGMDAIIGMKQPDSERAPAAVYQLSPNDWEIRNGNTFFANYVNWSGVAADWNMGIGYYDAAGELQIVGSYKSAQLNRDYYVGQEFPVTGLPAGTYHIVPVSKRSTDREWHSKMNPDISYVRADVDNSGQVQLEIHPVEQMTVTGIGFPGNHKRGDRQTVTATFQNLGDEYLREIHLLASTTNEKGRGICRTNVGIPVGGESTASFTFTPDVAGTWNIWLATDIEGKNIVGQATVDITEEGLTAESSLRFVSLMMTNRSNNIIYGNKTQGKVTIINQHATPYDGRIRLGLFRGSGNGLYWGAGNVYVDMHIEPNRTAQASFFFDNLEIGSTYAMSIIYGDGGDIQDGGLRLMGSVQPGIVYWDQNMSLGGMPLAGTVKTPAGAVALDLRSVTTELGGVTPNTNPNTLYLLPEGSSCPASLEGRNVVIGSHAEQIALKDNYGFLVVDDFTASHASYTRQASAGIWETVALPFPVATLPEGTEVCEFAQVGDAGEVVFEPTDEMVGNVPYLMRSGATGALAFEATDVTFSSGLKAPMAVGTADYRFVGTTVRQRVADIFLLNGEGSAFLPAASQVQVNPFRAYFSAPATVSSISTPTGTMGVEATAWGPDADGHYYNLQGTRVAHPGRGLYIKNGKKIIR